MSRKHHECYSNMPSVYTGTGCGVTTGGFGLVGITLLILIILQFGKTGLIKGHKNKCEEEEYDDYDNEGEEYDRDCEDEDEEDERYEEDDYKEERGHEPLVDNGILFIIALFYLSCCGKRWC
jgi:ATP:corrinoid adenosyltransferase